MPKFHVNDRGDPGKCQAQNTCPFGGSDKHYDSPEAARFAYEKYHYGSAVPSHRKSPKALELEANRRGVWSSHDESIASVTTLDSSESAALSAAIYQMENFYNLAVESKGKFLLASNEAQALTDLRDTFGNSQGNVLVLTANQEAALASFLYGLDEIKRRNGRWTSLPSNDIDALFTLRKRMFNY